MKRSMAWKWVGLWFAVMAGASCGGERSDELDPAVGRIRQALTVQERILGYEGVISGSGADWTATVGTATASTTAFSGAQSMLLGSDWNPQAISIPFAIGSIASTATIRVRLPSTYQGQGSWLGQIALFLHSPSSGVYNAYAGPVALVGPLSTWTQYSIPIPAAVVSALSSGASDFQVAVVVNGSAANNTLRVDNLVLEAPGGGGTGGTGGGGTGGASSGGTGTGGTTGGAGGSSGSPPLEPYDFWIQTPVDVPASDVVLGSHGTLKVWDGVDLLVEGAAGHSSASHTDGTSAAWFGSQTDVQNIWSTSGVSLGHFAEAHGDVFSAGAPIVLAPSAVIHGTSNDEAELEPFERLEWQVEFPATITNTTTVVNAFQTQTPAAGARFGSLWIKANGKLKLNPGIYYFDSLTIDGKLEVSNATAGVFVYVRQSLVFNGTVIEEAANANVLVGLAGRPGEPANAHLNKAFRGVVVAPYGEIRLGATSAGHVGSFYGEKVECKHSPFHPAIVKHRPFDPKDLCTALPAAEQEECSPFCPCGPEIFVNCVVPILDDRGLALFGYNNPTGEPFDIPAGDDNRVVPPSTSSSVAPPEVFEPGVHTRALWVPIEGESVTWEVRGMSAVATLGSPNCTVDQAYPRQPGDPIDPGEAPGELSPLVPRPAAYGGSAGPSDAEMSSIFAADPPGPPLPDPTLTGELIFRARWVDAPAGLGSFANGVLGLITQIGSSLQGGGEDFSCGDGVPCAAGQRYYYPPDEGGGNCVPPDAPPGSLCVVNDQQLPLHWKRQGTIDLSQPTAQVEVTLDLAGDFASFGTPVFFLNIDTATGAVTPETSPDVEDLTTEYVEFAAGWRLYWDIEMVRPVVHHPKICTTWNAAYLDAGFGEDDDGASVPGAEYRRYPASYARFEARLQGPFATSALVEQGHLDAQGCTPVDIFPPEAFFFEGGAAPGQPGGLDLALTLRTNFGPMGVPGFQTPRGVGYGLTSVNNVNSGVVTSISTKAGDVPLSAWTRVGGWAFPPEQIDVVTDHRSPMTNIAATISALLAKDEELGIFAPDVYEIEQGGVCTPFNDAFDNPVVTSCGGDPVIVATPQPAFDLEECTLGCADPAQTCTDLVSRSLCSGGGPCGCIPSRLVGQVEPLGETCNADADCPDQSTQGCFDRETFVPCAAGPCLCLAKCDVDSDCSDASVGCYDAQSRAPCAQTDGPCICMKHDGSRWRSIVTHEIGHQIQSHAVGGRGLGDSYRFCRPGQDCPDGDRDANSLNDPPTLGAEGALCTCNHVRSSNAWHCLQSIERTGSAQREGFAHFFASRVWNDGDETDCTFPYYKEFLGEAGAAPLLPPVGVDCAGAYKWRNNHCDMGNADMGTELDWLAFLYNLNTLGAEETQVLMTDLWKIYKLACAPPPTLVPADPAMCLRLDPVLLWESAEPRLADTAGCTAASPTCTAPGTACVEANEGGGSTCDPGEACLCKPVLCTAANPLCPVGSTCVDAAPDSLTTCQGTDCVCRPNAPCATDTECAMLPGFSCRGGEPGSPVPCNGAAGCVCKRLTPCMTDSQCANSPRRWCRDDFRSAGTDPVDRTDDRYPECTDGFCVCVEYPAFGFVDGAELTYGAQSTEAEDVGDAGDTFGVGRNLTP